MTPPKKATAAKKDAAPSKGPGRPSNLDKLNTKLTDTVTQLGVFVMVVNQADGVAIIQGAGPLADALTKLAAENPRVRAALERAMETTAWGGVIMAVGGIAVPIAVNHGLMPATLFGGEPPAVDGATPPPAGPAPDDLAARLADVAADTPPAA